MRLVYNHSPAHAAPQVPNLPPYVEHSDRSQQVELTRAVDTLAEGGDAVRLLPAGLTTRLPNTGGFWLTVPFEEELVRTSRRHTRRDRTKINPFFSTDGEGGIN